MDYDESISKLSMCVNIIYECVSIEIYGHEGVRRNCIEVSLSRSTILWARIHISIGDGDGYYDA